MVKISTDMHTAVLEVEYSEDCKLNEMLEVFECARMIVDEKGYYSIVDIIPGKSPYSIFTLLKLTNFAFFSGFKQGYSDARKSIPFTENKYDYLEANLYRSAWVQDNPTSVEKWIFKHMKSSKFKYEQKNFALADRAEALEWACRPVGPWQRIART